MNFGEDPKILVLYSTARTVHVKDRVLYEVVPLSEEFSEVLSSLIEGSTKCTMTYVLCTEFIRSASHYYGIVRNPDGSICGLDVTDGNSTKVSVHASHIILLFQDVELACRLETLLNNDLRVL